MAGSNTWIPVILAVVAAFGGAPLFKYLAARVKSNAAIKQDSITAFEKEKEVFRKERDQFWADQRRDALAVRGENVSMRDAMNDLSNRNGWLEGQLEACHRRIKELEADMDRQRNERNQHVPG